MLTRHDVVLFDIDHTLMNFTESNATKVVWNGGVELWAHYITLLKETAENFERRIHFGIATSKPWIKPEFVGTAYDCMLGDILSATILENEVFYPFYPNIPELGPGLGLKRFIDQDLVFFTNGYPKSKHALERAFNKIKEDHGERSIDKKNIIIIDDRIEIYHDAVNNDYSAVCCGDLDILQEEQKKITIAKVFKLVFEMLMLPLPREILDQAQGLAQVVEEEETWAEVESEEEYSEIDDGPGEWEDEEDRIAIVVDKIIPGKLKRLRLFNTNDNPKISEEKKPIKREDENIIKKIRI